MNKLHRFTTYVVLILACSSISNLVLSEVQVESPVVLAQATTHTLHAEEIDENFVIDVFVPLGYENTDIEYPVVYMTDGGYLFPMLTASQRMMQLAQEMPATIFIGIRYQTAAPLTVMALRARDLTPSDDQSFKKVNGFMFASLPDDFQLGKAETFLNFIDTEVKPFVNASYRINQNDQTLVGHSFGGLFNLFVLFNHTNSFDRYVIASPSIWWHDSVILTFEGNYAKNHTDLPKTVFLSAGSLENGETNTHNMVRGMETMYELLLSRKYPSLKISKMVFDNETHVSVMSTSLNTGLRNVFKK